MKKLPWLAFGAIGLVALILASVAVGYAPQRTRQKSPSSERSAHRRGARLSDTNEPANWRVIGPGGGGAFYSPAISPLDRNVILASTDMTGCFISKDGGVTWRAFYLRWRCTSFSFDSRNPDVFYAMASSLFVTEDGGNTWKLAYPMNANGVLFHDDEGDISYTYSGKYQDQAAAVAADPTRPDTVYLAAASQIWVSSDRGANWKVLLMYKDGKSAPKSLFVDPSSPPEERSFVMGGGTFVRFCRPSGCQSSVPQNTTWIYSVTAGAQPGGGPLAVYALIDPKFKGDQLTGGLLVSKDSGATWLQVTDTLLPMVKEGSFPSFLTAATCASNSNIIYLSYTRLVSKEDGNFYLGVLRSEDGGASWHSWWKENNSALSAAVSDTWVTPLFGAEWGENPLGMGVHPSDPSYVVSTDLGRILISHNGGETWKAAYSNTADGGGFVTTGLDVTTSYGVHVDPFHTERIFVTYTDIGLWRSDDGGRSWRYSAANIPRNWRNTAYWMEFDPAVEGKAWAVFSNIHDLPRIRMKKNVVAASARGGVAISEDGGSSWRTIQSKGLPDSPVTHLLMDPASPSSARVLYVTSFNNGVYKSVDGGESWESASTGLPESRRAWRLSRDSEGGLYLVMASFDGTGVTEGNLLGSLWYSNDGAASWKQVALPSGITFPSGLTVDPRDPARLYLAAWPRYKLYVAKKLTDGGVFLSTNRGASWSQVLKGDGYAYDVTFDPSNPDLLYATGPTASAWRSLDAGATWSKIAGYRFKAGHRIIPDPVYPGKIFITTFGNSVWYGPAGGVPGATEDISGPSAVLFTPR